MFLNKLKFVAVVVLALGLLGSGVALLGHRGDAQPPRPRPEADGGQAPEAGSRPKAERPAKASEEMAVLLKERAARARKCYEAAAEGIRTTRRSGNTLTPINKPEDVYTWSLRWLQAERDLHPRHEDQIAALEGHLKRMAELRKVVEEQSHVLLTKIKVDEAEWYRLEAAIWLARAKAAR